MADSAKSKLPATEVVPNADNIVRKATIIAANTSSALDREIVNRVNARLVAPSVIVTDVQAQSVRDSRAESI